MPSTHRHRGWRIMLSALPLVLLCQTTAMADFVNVAEEAGVDVTGVRGVSWADYDRDGCADLLITRQTGAVLFRNTCNGSGRFENVTRAAGLPGPPDAWTPAWADYDGDGDLDVYITGGTTTYGDDSFFANSPNALYRNDGDGTFTNVAAQARVDSRTSATGASWADYDNDGDLDLFVANHFRTASRRNIQDSLYRNNGDGTFTDVAPEAGITGSEFRQSFMGVWFDYDRNGTQDLYLAVDFGPDVLYHNQGNGTFIDISAAAGIGAPEHGMGVAIGDLDANGCLDIISTNNTQADDAEHGPSVLYMNNCDGTFHDATTALGILDRRTVEWGPNFIDWDNDGDLDVAVTAGGMLSSGEPNVLYENRCIDGLCRLVDVTDSVGVSDQGAAFGSAWADYDNDGDLDWFVANAKGGPSALFRNDSTAGNFLKVRLIGVQSNTHGVGSFIRLTADGRTQYATIQSGLGYASDEQQLAFFGLGNAQLVEEIIVNWPSGAITQIRNTGANQTINIVEANTIGPNIVGPNIVLPAPTQRTIVQSVVPNAVPLPAPAPVPGPGAVCKKNCGPGGGQR